MATSADIGDPFINGDIALALSGVIRGVVHGPNWREVTIEQSGATLSVRFFDDTPITIDELTEGEPDVIVPEPIEGEPPTTGLGA